MRTAGRAEAAGSACLLLFNAGARALDFALPAGRWRVLMDSASPDAPAHEIGGGASVPARAVWLAVAPAGGAPTRT